MKSILIIDSVCYKPYTYSTLETEALGGSEASVMRLARQLAKSYVVHVLNGSQEATDGHGINYVTPETQFKRPSSVIHMRTCRLLPEMSAAFPSAQQVIWHHDVGGHHTKDEIENMQKYAPDLVFVSVYHRGQFFDRGVFPYYPEYQHKGTSNVAYNIVDAAPVEGTAHNKYKLIFPSSPHKGLQQTLEVFAALRKKIPQLELHVANPGYYPTPNIQQDGVVVLGPLTHAKLLDEMRTSLAVFAANHVFPESFGLVYAEANAVGTPCIAHNMGALGEILDARQLVDTRITQKVMERLEMFMAHRPSVALKEEFKAEAVEAQWRKILK